MANRVTQAEVLEIIDTSIADISAFITAANLIVTERLTDSGLSAAYLKEIERWLAAHFVSIRDPKIKAEKIGDSNATYESAVTGKALQGSSYGQQVLLLDTTGILSQLGKKKVVFQVDDFRDA